MEFLLDWGYLGLFVGSFLAATLLPMSSESLLILLVLKGLHLPSLIGVASCGNILGGMFNYALGRAGKLEWISRYLKISQKKVESFQHRIERYGPTMAFFTWLPVVGDPMAVSLGYFRLSAFRVFLFMSLGKGLRYVVLTYMTYRFMAP